MADLELTCSALQADLYDMPELADALTRLLRDRLARYIHADRKREPMEVLLYCTPSDVPRISDILAPVGLRCAWGPRQGEPGGYGWACYLPGEVAAGGNP
jgi:hypothetical protein